MKRTLMIAASAMTLALAGPAFAADKPAANPDATDTTSAMPSPQTGVDDKAPLPGANSFTEAQVKSRLEEHGFTEVMGLTLDDQGIWRGTAKMQTTTFDVAVDYRGNIVYGGTIMNKNEG
jgi:putative membrane protein